MALQEKLRAVGHFIETIESLVTKSSRAIDLRIEIEGPLLQGVTSLTIMHEEMGQLFTSLVPPTHIEKDLERARAKLGQQDSVRLAKEAAQRLQALMAPDQRTDLLRAGIIESKNVIVQVISKALDPARALREQLIADLDRPAEGPYFTAKQEADRFEVDEGNIRKWCAKEGQVHGCKKAGNTWQIPESTEQYFPKTWCKRLAQPNREPQIPLWRCVNCEHEVRQEDKPAKCAKCPFASFVRVREHSNPSSAR